MKNPSKVILILLFLLFIIVVFFAYTGVNVNKPEEAMYILVDKVVELNRAINQMFRNLFWSIRTTVLGWFGR
jgi:Na+/H+ antiporter NhaC